jgi:hypothetical protein
VRRNDAFDVVGVFAERAEELPGGLAEHDDTRADTGFEGDQHGTPACVFGEMRQPFDFVAQGGVAIAGR